MKALGKSVVICGTCIMNSELFQILPGLACRHTFMFLLHEIFMTFTFGGKEEEGASHRTQTFLRKQEGRDQRTHPDGQKHEDILTTVITG